MIIEILAIETSGFSPETDHVLEWAVVKFDTTDSSCDVEKGFILPPADYQLSDNIVKYHTDTGLLPDLMGSNTTPIMCGSADVRVLWSKDFALKFLPEAVKPLYVGALDGLQTLRLNCALAQKNETEPSSRAFDKAICVAASYALICKG